MAAHGRHGEGSRVRGGGFRCRGPQSPGVCSAFVLTVLCKGRLAAVGVATLLSTYSTLSEFSGDTSVFEKYQEMSQRRQRVAVSECLTSILGRFYIILFYFFFTE